MSTPQNMNNLSTKIVLDEEELILINKVFKELQGFDQVIDDLEQALSNNLITHYQLKKIFKIMTRTVYYQISLNCSGKTEKGLARTFFELPEIISKKVRVFAYNMIAQQAINHV